MFAAKRLDLLQSMMMLDATPEVEDLVERLIKEGPMRVRALFDAAHIAVAAVHEVDFLLTWNCKHIANATMHRGLTRICSPAGYDLPVLCTSEQLLGE